MALSAMIKHVMPTMPLEGVHVAVGSKETVAVVAFIGFASRLFVFPVGIGRVLDVPKRAATLDRRSLGKIVFRRRRRRGPLECPRIPGIVSSRRSFARGAQKVEDEDEDPN